MSNIPTHVLVHCSDSTWGDAAEIARWHKAKGWNTIGYHYVITNGHTTSKGAYVPARDGALETGRPEATVGAHCPAYNARSVAVCLIGRGTYSAAQLARLTETIADVCTRYNIPAERVIGHCEAGQASRPPGSCPMLDMDALRARVATALTEKVSKLHA